MSALRISAYPIDIVKLAVSQKPGLARVLLMSALLGLGLIAGCAQEQAPAGRFNPLGTAGVYDERAEIAFAKAHALWRNDQCADPDKAILWLNEAVQVEPAYAEAWMWRGRAYGEKGQYALALEDMDRSVRLAPTPLAYAYRGWVQTQLGNLLGAEADLDYALQLDPASYRAWNFRGQMHMQRGDSARACDDFAAGCRYGACDELENAKKRGLCQ